MVWTRQEVVQLHGEIRLTYSTKCESIAVLLRSDGGAISQVVTVPET